MSELGKLKQVKDLRTVWPDEARAFTPWLAKEKNLALVGETLGFGPDWLELVTTEAEVGTFRADILCQDTSRDDQFVVIENQFGSTDHDHLGKLLTYAAGRKAKTVVWVAEYVRDEHRAAIDLLNDATSDDYQFFALEIELWRIGESPIAPRFNVIAKPNDWTRAVAKSTRKSSFADLTDLKRDYIDYWAAFKTVLEENSSLRCQKPSPQQWMYMAIGRAGFTLTASVNTRESWINAELTFHGDNAGSFFKLMETQQTEINELCPFDLSWEEMPGRKSARISVKKFNVRPTDREDWPNQHAWLVEKLNQLYELFHDRVKKLNLGDLPDEDTT